MNARTGSSARRPVRGPAAATTEPVVSVVIPCWNQGGFLGDAIESVLAQTYRHVEIIVVDDGSTDCTAAVAARFPCVRCISQQNQGLAAARNAGLARSTGDLVVFLDADDRLLPDALEIGARRMTADTRLAFVAGRSRFIAADGTPLGTLQPRRGGAPYLALLRRNTIRNPAMVMFRRRVLEAVGGFDPRVNACADYDMYLRISRAYPVVFHEAVVAEYRKHAENMSLDAGLMLRQAVAVLKGQRPYARTPGRRAALRDGLRSVRTYYGDRLAAQIRDRVRSGAGWRRVAADLGTLLWWNPAGAFEHARRKVRCHIRRPAAAQRPG